MSDETTPDWKIAAVADFKARLEANAAARKAALGRRDRLDKKIAALDDEDADLIRGAKAFGLPVDVTAYTDDVVVTGPGDTRAVIQVKSTDVGGSPLFKEFALRLLKEAAPRSMKAAEVQAVIEKEMGRKYHWKTAGMTLYRLKKEGLIDRKGQDWFAITHPGQIVITELRAPDHWEQKSLELREDPGEQGPPDDEDRDWRD